MWCKHCKRNQPTTTDEATCSLCCNVCGRVVGQDFFSEEPTFVKGPGGESRMAGSFVRSIQRDYSESLERSLNNGKAVIHKLSLDLDMNNSLLENEAARLYQVAAERGFTRGRRIDQVAAACLYIACRIKEKAYLLIDFSEKLGINVYVLGAVFLQLCELLRLEEHPIVQKPIDPSIFINLFTTRLLGDKGGRKLERKVSTTALHIIASMKRDWMQTGRKPSGLCGAAIYISALSEGFKCTKSDVLQLAIFDFGSQFDVKVVHICEATLTKRLIEFENTSSGSLTIEEFNKNAEELEEVLEEQLRSQKQSGDGSKSSGAAELLCEHKGSGAPPFAHGLCKECYAKFIKLSGGLEGGADPPAFQHAERERTSEVSAEKTNESDVVDASHPERTNDNHATETFADVEAFAKANQNLNNNGKADLADSDMRNVDKEQVRVESAFDMCDKNKAVNTEDDESDYLSDIDDIEVNGYLNNKEETHFKKIIWEEMNKEYLEEQAAKEAAAAAAAVNIGEFSDDLRAAHELSAAAAAAVAKSRKERQQKRASEAKNAAPAQTAAEATRQMLTKKRLSSKINYDVLEQLFSGDDLFPDSKKSRIESQDSRDTAKPDQSEKEHEAVTMDNSDEFGLGNEDTEDLDGEEEDEEDSYFRNEDGAYDFDNNDDFDNY